MSFYMTINGRKVEAEEGEMVLEVARRSGFHIPTLCTHDAVEPYGACRLCMVEVTRPGWDGWKKLVTSCLYPAEPGLEVETDSERVHSVRRTVLDLLLARTPRSDLVRKLAAGYEVYETSFEPRPDPDLCILCGLCVRVCEKAATGAISMVDRGHERQVGTPWGDPPPDCIGCLACANVCPTGQIRFVQTATTRTIWGRKFELARCERCGAPLSMTEEQVEFVSARPGLDAGYFALCPECSRADTARTFGRMAGWGKLGLRAEQKAERQGPVRESADGEEVDR